MKRDFFERENPSNPALSALEKNSLPSLAVISPYNYSNGLGQAGRGYAASLMHTNLKYSLHPIKRPFHVHTRKCPDWGIEQSPCAPDVAIIHINPDAWSGLLSDNDARLISSSRRRIGLFVWELSKLPGFWLEGLNSVDAIIAPSEYCATIFRMHTTVPVYVVPHPVPVPPPDSMHDMDSVESARALRKKCSIPDNCRIILYVFDGSSFLARKNPFSLIRAFKQSSLRLEGWHLALKTKHVFDVPETGQSLLSAIDGDPSISLLNLDLSDRELETLFQLAEMYVSPHCSEGFGLTIAEAMARGKLVVATDFGGSRDFLDKSCGYPVEYEMVTLQENYGPYQMGGQWAMINESALVCAMRAAAKEADCKDRFGEPSIASRARARIAEKLSYASVGSKLETIVKIVHSAPQYSDRTGF